MTSEAWRSFAALFNGSMVQSDVSGRGRWFVWRKFESLEWRDQVPRAKKLLCFAAHNQMCSRAGPRPVRHGTLRRS
jgi:hypothetical protein